jgi:hypothetical protein
LIAEDRARTGRSLSAGKATVVLAMAMLIAAMLRHRRNVRRVGGGHGAGLRRDRVARQAGRVRVNAEDRDLKLTTTAAEDLEADRGFERSLVAREAAVVALIAALIVVRQLLS